jgi:hypothetical protein
VIHRHGDVDRRKRDRIRLDQPAVEVLHRVAGNDQIQLELLYDSDLTAQLVRARTVDEQLRATEVDCPP